MSAQASVGGRAHGVELFRSATELIAVRSLDTDKSSISTNVVSLATLVQLCGSGLDGGTEPRMTLDEKWQRSKDAVAAETGTVVVQKASPIREWQGLTLLTIPSNAFLCLRIPL